MTGEDATVFIQPATLNMGGEDEDYMFELADDLSIEMVVVTKKNTNSKKAISAIEDELTSSTFLCFLIILQLHH